jgi:endoglucanase
MDQNWNYQGDDWDPGHTKGECSAGWAQTGLSKQMGAAAHAVLCRQSNTEALPGHRPLVPDVRVALPGNNQRTNRMGSDWAPGYWKLECGQDEYLSGSSMSTAAGGYNFTQFAVHTVTS